MEENLLQLALNRKGYNFNDPSTWNFSAWSPSVGTQGTVGTQEKQPKSLLDKAMMMDYGLSIFDFGASLFQGIQALTKKQPDVSRMAAPQVTSKPLYNAYEAGNAQVKKNLSSTVNSLVERAKETGTNNLATTSAIFTAANKAAGEATTQLSRYQQELANRANLAAQENEWRNAQASYTAGTEYLRRRDTTLMQDAMMRSQQISAAVSNIGGIASRLMNDVLYKHLLSE